MGKRGPAPVPTELLKLRGSTKANARKGEPQPRKNKPKMPSHMSDGAKAVWRAVVPMLEHMQVLTEVDGMALERYCVAFARWRECERVIDEQGAVMEFAKDGGTYAQQRPEVGISNKLATMLLRLEQEFGLTPAARARLRTETEQNAKGSNGAAEFFAA